MILFTALSTPPPLAEDSVSLIGTPTRYPISAMQKKYQRSNIFAANSGLLGKKGPSFVPLNNFP